MNIDQRRSLQEFTRCRRCGEKKYPEEMSGLSFGRNGLIRYYCGELNIYECADCSQSAEYVTEDKSEAQSYHSNSLGPAVNTDAITLNVTGADNPNNIEQWSAAMLLICNDEAVKSLQPNVLLPLKVVTELAQFACRYSLLRSTDSRKIYDRLRQELANTIIEADLYTPSTSELQLLEVESADQRVQRMLNDKNGTLSENDANLKRKTNEDSDDDSDIIGPSVKSSKSVFNTEDAELLRNTCSQIIKEGPISKRRIMDVFKNCNDQQSLGYV